MHSDKKNRFQSKKYNFYAETTIDFLRNLSSFYEFKYDIAYSHLVLQLFTEEQVLEIYQLLFQKKICKAIFISDSCLSAPDNSSNYNTGGDAYIRFDHDHVTLLKKAGFSVADVVADYRDINNLNYSGFVYWRGIY